MSVNVPIQMAIKWSIQHYIKLWTVKLYISNYIYSIFNYIRHDQLNCIYTYIYILISISISILILILIKKNTHIYIWIPSGVIHHGLLQAISHLVRAASHRPWAPQWNLRGWRAAVGAVEFGDSNGTLRYFNGIFMGLLCDFTGTFREFWDFDGILMGFNHVQSQIW